MASAGSPYSLLEVVADALSASLVSTPQAPTSVYRMRGSNKTWTWGNQGCWIESEKTGRVLMNLLDQYPDDESFKIRLFEEYVDWLGLFQDLCPYRQTVPRISYRNPMVVNAYLVRHPEVADFLRAAWPNLVRCFGGPVQIILEVMTYTEDEDYEELVGWIQSTDDVYEGLDKLERFNDEWFLDHMDEVGNKFNFNIETK